MDPAFQKERLQPSLLDRLVDESPAAPAQRAWFGRRPKEVEDGLASQSGAAASGGVAFISARRLRELVTRDLGWLFNTVNLEPVQSDLGTFPLVERSVVNFGVRELNGLAVSGLQLEEIETHLRQAILHFEPRIIPNSLQVSVVRTEHMDGRSVSFDIDCDIWGQPVPEHLIIRSMINLEDGSIELSRGRS